MSQLVESAGRHLLVLACLAGLCLLQGCPENSESSGARATELTADNADRFVLAGPDALGGEGDFFARSNRVEIVVDAAGLENPIDGDPGSTADDVPVSNLYAPSGGNLTDIELRNHNNDGWTQMAQLAIGLQESGEEVNSLFFQCVYHTVGVGPVQVAPGVFFGEAGPTRSIVSQGFIVNGTGGDEEIAGTSTTTVGSLPAAQQPTGLNPATPIVVNSLGVPIVVVTTYSVRGGQDSVDVQTTFLSLEGGGLQPDPVAIAGAVDFVLLADDRNFRVFTPLLGFNEPTPLDFDDPAASAQVVPYVTLVGKDEPGVSYTMADTVTSQLVVITDGEQILLARQLADPATTVLTPDSPVQHNRRIFVGGENDVASSADLAIKAFEDQLDVLRVVGVPNGIFATGEVSGRIIDAPPGTEVLLVQTFPALTFVPFDDLSPTGQAGFFPLSVLSPGAPGLPITSVKVDENGRWKAKVPRGFEFSPQGLFEEDSQYLAVVQAPERPVLTQSFGVNQRFVKVRGEGLKFGETFGTISWVATDEDGVLLPVRVTFVGKDDAGDRDAANNPDFGAPADEDRADGTKNVVFDWDGVGSAELEPGGYDVIFSRGFEYDIAQFSVFLLPGQELDLGLVVLEQVVDTSGWVSGDFHVHSGRSFDSAVPLEDRVASALAEGLEVMVATEHNNIADYGPALDDLNRSFPRAERLLKTVVGDEVSGYFLTPPPPLPPLGIGHWCAFPLELQETQQANGASPSEFRAPTTVFSEIDAQDGDTANTRPIITLTHPRALPLLPVGGGLIGQGYFDNIMQRQPNEFDGFEHVADRPGARRLSHDEPYIPLQFEINDPDPAEATIQGARITFLGLVLDPSNTFDAIEVYNVSQDLRRALEGRRDWFDLMLFQLDLVTVGLALDNPTSAVPKTGISVSDAHSLDPADQGLPGGGRSYMQIDATDMRDVTDDDVVTALRPAGLQLTGPVTCSAGAFIEITEIRTTAGGAALATANPIGQLVTSDPTTRVELDIRIQAPLWVGTDPGEELEAYVVVDGERHLVKVVENKGVPLNSFETALPLDNASVVRFEGTVALDDLADGVDHFILVEAHLPIGDVDPVDGFDTDSFVFPSATSDYGVLYPGQMPWSFTNPVFLNRDVNTDYDPF